MVNFSRRWNGDGCFSPMMEWRWYLKILTITIDGSWQEQPLAAMVFQWFFQFWGPMFHDGCELRVNKTSKTEMQAINLIFSNVLHFQKISHIFQITRLVILVIIGLFDISFSQIKRQTIYYHRHKSMVSKVTIAIDGMVPAQPLGPMVFRWVFSQPTIGDNVFQWLPTIGPTMRR